ncbi:MAG TPA: hypothetical protein VGP48_12525 [Stellaceae bacterium]|jgi:hypothetical protein|nr:hypothetical protein [Stellaceae bacterium]
MPRATIAYTPAVFALKRLHAELGGRIKENRKEALRLAQDMKHVEAVLKMMQPDFNIRSIAARRRNKQASPYKRGQVFRAVLEVLRGSERPLTSREISEALLHKAGIADPPLKQVRDMVGSVHSSLRNHQGKTIERVGDHIPARWRLLG